MGWASGGEYFYTVASVLTRLGVSDDIRYEVCVALISSLQGGDWDTEGEALGDFFEDEAIRRAFRDCGVIQQCNDSYEEVGEDGRPVFWDCDLEVEHSGEHIDPGYEFGTYAKPERRWGP